MKRNLLFISLVFFLSIGYGQSQNSNNISIGGYAQVDYNQVVDPDFRKNGVLDVHRMVMTFGYKFNKRTSFFTEIEYEHVKEVFVEQAFLRYKINDFINFKGGLLLIPMGIINERHEPNIFHGVERPNVDKTIVPTTWREIGAGFAGRFDDLSLKYQLYLVNSFNGYDGSGKFDGKNGLRKGRQKGAKSFMSSPNISAKVDYYGLANLKLGLATYMGKSQSTLYNGLDKKDASALVVADSSVVGVTMVGLDAQYTKGGLQMRGQYVLANISNAAEYNTFTGNDVGSTLMGYYLELAYNVLQKTESDTELYPFIRYENYNTHANTEGELTANDALNKTEITFGLSWKMTKGAVLKADYQIINSKGGDAATYQFNLGVGVGFIK